MTKKHLKDVATIQLCIVAPSKEKESKSLWLTAGNLQINNTITQIDLDDRYKIDEKLEVRNEDIIIKRINPLFINYVENITDSVYATNNLFIVRAKNIDSSYLAFVLNNCIEQFSNKMSFGSAIPSLGRRELGEIEIPILPLNEQANIGRLWLLAAKKNILRNRLTELEQQKYNYMLSKYIGGIN